MNREEIEAANARVVAAGGYDENAKVFLSGKVISDWEKLRHRRADHTQQQTYAGHVWRLVDDKTNTILHYFVATKSPGKLIYKPGKKK